MLPKDKDFQKALEIGRPPNITKLFPNSKALLVSSKAIDRAMRARGHAIAIATNARNSFVLRGALRAAQRANAAIIIEIAKSEGGAKAYCAVNYWNLTHRTFPRTGTCSPTSSSIPSCRNGQGSRPR
jgi:fructose-bisphosphate aldolase class II